MATTIGTTDFNAIVDRHGRTVTLRRLTRTLDGDGKDTADPTATDTTGVKAVLMDLSPREYENFAAGNEVTPNRKAFVKASYGVTTKDRIIVTEDTEEYEVVAVKNNEDAGSDVFTTVYLRLST